MDVVHAILSNAKPVTSKRVLCLDGGGIRGLLEVQMLRKIVEECKKLNKGKEKPIRELFDVICGTSTGGLLTLALTIGVDEHGQPLSLDVIEKMYREVAADVFSHPQPFWPVKVKFDAKNLEKIIRKYVKGYQKPSEGHAQAFVVSTDVNGLAEYLWRSYDLGAKGSISGRTITDLESLVMAARATSAAPTYFDAQVDPKDNKNVYVDGGLCFNNPSMLAMAEATAMYGDANQQVPYCALISMGTGLPDPKDPVKGNVNLLQLGELLINIATEANRTHKLVQQFLNNSPVYLRMNAGDGIGSLPLDAHDDADLAKLIAAGKKCADENEGAILALAHYLLEPTVSILSLNESAPKAAAAVEHLAYANGSDARAHAAPPPHAWKVIRGDSLASLLKAGRGCAHPPMEP